jgi:2-keto-4-pentenoate hydratase/2-oxohepta-3-ene-1,7-dioic acid hydratase in catechol pathway
MICDVLEIIGKLSESYMLAPGDPIFTGTPAVWSSRQQAGRTN